MQAHRCPQGAHVMGSTPMSGFSSGTLCAAWDSPFGQAWFLVASAQARLDSAWGYQEGML